jgi:hypothetical protein
VKHTFLDGTSVDLETALGEGVVRFVGGTVKIKRQAITGETVQITGYTFCPAGRTSQMMANLGSGKRQRYSSRNGVEVSSHSHGVAPLEAELRSVAQAAAKKVEQSVTFADLPPLTTVWREVGGFEIYQTVSGSPMIIAGVIEDMFRLSIEDLGSGLKLQVPADSSFKEPDLFFELPNAFLLSLQRHENESKIPVGEGRKARAGNIFSVRVQSSVGLGESDLQDSTICYLVNDEFVMCAMGQTENADPALRGRETFLPIGEDPRSHLEKILESVTRMKSVK